MSVLLQINGVDTLVPDDDPRVPKPVPPPGPQTVFDPETLITTLFTPKEQLGFTAAPQGILFATLIAAAPSIDIASSTFKAYIAQAVAGGMLTQDRANQVLAGTPAPQGSTS